MGPGEVRAKDFLGIGGVLMGVLVGLLVGGRWRVEGWRAMEGGVSCLYLGFGGYLLCIV